MNLYFGLFCSPSVLFNSSELGFDFFASRNNARQKNLNKRLLIPILHMFACLVSIHRKMWIQQQTSCLHHRLVSLAWFWCYGGSYLFQKYSSLHAQSLNNICTVATPGQTLARWCSWRAVYLFHRLHSPHPKPQPAHFNNSTTRQPRSEKPLQTSGSHTFLSFSCFSIANLEAVPIYGIIIANKSFSSANLQNGPCLFFSR